MGKVKKGLVGISLWVLGTLIVLFNNTYQFTNIVLENKNLLISFLLAVFVVTMYAIKNKKKIK